MPYVGGDRQRSEATARAMQIFIESTPDKSLMAVFKAELHRLSAESASISYCRMRHRIKTQCANHAPPKLTWRKKPSRYMMSRARIMRARQMIQRGEMTKKAPVLSCGDFADLIFKLWTCDGSYGTSKRACHIRQRRTLAKCLAQLGVLAYLHGSRLNEVVPLSTGDLDQAACAFGSSHYKKIGNEGKVKHSDVYTAMAYKDEQHDFQQLWKLLDLDKGLLFDKRWSNASAAARQLPAVQRAMGLTSYKPISRGSAVLQGHSFRRCRGVHLVQHGIQHDDIQRMYSHEKWQQTEEYLIVGVPLHQLEEVKFKDGVFALLRWKLEEHCGHQAIAQMHVATESTPAKSGTGSPNTVSTAPSSGAGSPRTANTLVSLEELRDHQGLSRSPGAAESPPAKRRRGNSSPNALFSGGSSSRTASALVLDEISSDGAAAARSAFSESKFVSMNPTTSQDDKPLEDMVMVAELQQNITQRGMEFEDLPEDEGRLAIFLRDMGYSNEIERVRLMKLLRSWPC